MKGPHTWPPAGFGAVLGRIVRRSRAMQQEGHLLDMASQMELRMLEAELQRIQNRSGVLTLVRPPRESRERQELLRMTQSVRAQSAATQSASRQLRKQIIRQNLIDGDGRPSA